mgnify:FL=1
MGNLYVNAVNSYVSGRPFQRHNERPIEYRFVFDSITRSMPKTVLDVGTGTTPLPALMAACGCSVTAIDNVKDYWPRGMVNRHWKVLDDDISQTRLKKKFDMITCISVIEHIHDHEQAIKSMFGLLNPDGVIIITTPFNENEHHPDAYKIPGSNLYGKNMPYICRITDRSIVNRWVEENDGTILKEEHWRVWDGEFWRLGRQLPVPEQTDANSPHQLICLMIGNSRRQT